MIASTYLGYDGGTNTSTDPGPLEKIYIDFSRITSIGGAGFNPSTQTNGNGECARSAQVGRVGETGVDSGKQNCCIQKKFRKPEMKL